MARPFLVTIDGPKGVGKSTLLQNLRDALAPHVTLSCHVEKDLDPNRDAISRALRAAGAALTSDEERTIAILMAEGRACITQKVILPAQTEVLIFDRWFPSDAAFRRHLPFEECLALNQAAGVAMPDLVVAAHCRPEESWRRANAREQGLESLVIRDFEDHCRSTVKFRASVVSQGWTEVDMESPPEEIADHVVALICTHMARALSLR